MLVSAHVRRPPNDDLCPLAEKRAATWRACDAARRPCDTARCGATRDGAATPDPRVQQQPGRMEEGPRLCCAWSRAAYRRVVPDLFDVALVEATLRDLLPVLGSVLPCNPARHLPNVKRERRSAEEQSITCKEKHEQALPAERCSIIEPPSMKALLELLRSGVCAYAGRQPARAA